MLDAKVESIERCLRRIAERMRRAVGFRDVSVHEYDKIDWSRVYELITGRLGDFRLCVARVLASIDRGTGGSEKAER